MTHAQGVQFSGQNSGGYSYKKWEKFIECYHYLLLAKQQINKKFVMMQYPHAIPIIVF